MVKRGNPDSDNPSVDGADAAPAGSVPWGLVITAAWGWRLIVVGVLIAAIFAGLSKLTPIVVPLVVAVLISAPLERLVTRMERRRVPRALGSAIVLLTLTIIVLGLIALAGTSIVAGFDELRLAALEGFHTFLTWLSDGPLGIDPARIQGWTDQVTEALKNNWLGLANGALSATGTIGSFVAGALIALLSTFFFLKDGRGMWLWFVNLIGGKNAERIDHAGLNSWITLRRYTQTSAFVAFVDAVGIGLAAWILGIPLALPIAITVFLFSFIPLFGATISGAIAVAVALVDGGWTTALIMLGAVLVVQQLEGSVIYPWVFGKAASIHPMVILVSVSAGTLLAGFVGAVIAVPLVAATIAFIYGLNKEFVVKEPPRFKEQHPPRSRRQIARDDREERKAADAAEGDATREGKAT